MNIVAEKKYDVFVAGAGVAGVSAALQAARCGKKVALAEKMRYPGRHGHHGTCESV